MCICHMNHKSLGNNYFVSELLYSIISLHCFWQDEAFSRESGEGGRREVPTGMMGADS